MSTQEPHNEISDLVRYSRKLEETLKFIKRESRKNNPDSDEIYFAASDALMARGY